MKIYLVSLNLVDGVEVYEFNSEDERSKFINSIKEADPEVLYSTIEVEEK